MSTQLGNKKHTKKPKTTRLHPIEELLGESLVNSKGETIRPKTLVQQEGVIGLYFAAHWCPPCRAITPDLIGLYEEVRKAGHHMEIVWVSFDYSLESFQQYLSKMPWWAVGYDEAERREDIAIKYGIRGIPILAFLDTKSLQVITLQGRNIIFNDPEGRLFPWKNLPDPSKYLPNDSSESEQSGPGQVAVVNAEAEGSRQGTAPDAVKVKDNDGNKEPTTAPDIPLNASKVKKVKGKGKDGSKEPTTDQSISQDDVTFKSNDGNDNVERNTAKGTAPDANDVKGNDDIKEPTTGQDTAPIKGNEQYKNSKWTTLKKKIKQAIEATQLDQ